MVSGRDGQELGKKHPFSKNCSYFRVGERIFEEGKI